MKIIQHKDNWRPCSRGLTSRTEDVLKEIFEKTSQRELNLQIKSTPHDPADFHPQGPVPQLTLEKLLNSWRLQRSFQAPGKTPSALKETSETDHSNQSLSGLEDGIHLNIGSKRNNHGNT